MPTTEFLSASPTALASYEQAMTLAAATLAAALPAAPVSGRSPSELTALLADELCPRVGRGIDGALRDAAAIARHSIAVGHPAVAAHLHCPPLIAALAAEVLLTALNQSMDSFDQAPAATVIEQHLTDWLCAEAGLPAGAGGTFTSGGTQSNAMGLWLARDAWLQTQRGWSVKERGMPPDASRLAILCSEVAHFTVEKSAMQLGLGADAVVRVAVDEHWRMDVPALHAALERLQHVGRVPLAIVATAGTTDFGSIDPLATLAAIARAHHAWLHVDAAYGGALLFSPTRAACVRDMGHADSIGMDFHKLLWQPVSCGAFLLRNAAHFDLLTTHADYLNPERHDHAGIPDLVNRSLATTRRFDALKLWMTLRALGRDRLGALIDSVCALAQVVAHEVSSRPQLALVHVSAELSCVLFRVRLDGEDAAAEDAFNLAIRDDLYRRGQAVVGTTTVRGRICLKLTLLNPTATLPDMATLLDHVVEAGAALRHAVIAPGVVPPMAAATTNGAGNERPAARAYSAETGG